MTLGDPRTSNLREGQDVIIANALSLDIQVYDPTVPLKGDTGAANTATVALSPADQGWSARGITNNTLGHGAFVDLAYARGLIVYSRRTRDGIAGDHILVCPPLIMDDTHIDEIITGLDATLTEFVTHIHPQINAG